MKPQLPLLCIRMWSFHNTSAITFINFKFAFLLRCREIDSNHQTSDLFVSELNSLTTELPPLANTRQQVYKIEPALPLFRLKNELLFCR
jgi:hypothetical protein